MHLPALWTDACALWIDACVPWTDVCVLWMDSSDLLVNSFSLLCPVHILIYSLRKYCFDCSVILSQRMAVGFLAEGFHRVGLPWMHLHRHRKTTLSKQSIAISPSEDSKEAFRYSSYCQIRRGLLHDLPVILVFLKRQPLGNRDTKL